MKYIIVLFFALSFSIEVRSQEQTNDDGIIIGGFFNFSTQTNTFPFTGIISGIGGIGTIYSNSTEETKNTLFSFSPYIGKRLSTKWLVGAQVDIRTGKYNADNIYNLNQTEPVDFERKSNQIGAGVFGRYFINPQNKFQLYIQSNLGYNILNETEKSNQIINQEEESWYLEIGLSPGIIYQASQKINITTRFGGLHYLSGNWKIKDAETEKDFSSFSLHLNTTNIYFGFEIKFD